MDAFSLPSILTLSEATKANFSKAWGVLSPFYFKTILIALIGAVLETVISALLAYILVVKNFFFKELVFMLFISVLLVPSIIGYPILIPFFVLILHFLFVPQNLPPSQSGSSNYAFSSWTSR